MFVEIIPEINKRKNKNPHQKVSILSIIGTPGKIRTCDPLVRSQVL